MKRFFTVVSVATMLFSSFADEIYVIPASLEKGKTEASKGAALEVYVEGSSVWEAAQFDLWLPSSFSWSFGRTAKTAGTLVKDDEGATHTVGANSVSGAREGYSHFRITVTSNDGYQFQQESGQLCKLYISTDNSDLLDGLYPVYITDFELSKSGSKAKGLGTTSYIKIGNVSGESLNAENDLPSTVLTSMISDLVTLKLTRTVTNQYGTICAPFGMNSDNAIQYYTLSSRNGEKMIFKPVQHLDAGVPALFMVADKGEQELSWSNVPEVSAPVQGANGFTGSFQTITDAGYFIAEDKFWSTDKLSVPAFRAYLPSSKASTANLRIVIEDPNGIVELEADAEGNLTEVYNLQGQRLAAPVKGQVNIINGKKSLVR